jgi:hypothetical protein
MNLLNIVILTFLFFTSPSMAEVPSDSKDSDHHLVKYTQKRGLFDSFSTYVCHPQNLYKKFQDLTALGWQNHTNPPCNEGRNQKGSVLKKERCGKSYSDNYEYIETFSTFEDCAHEVMNRNK